MPESLNQRAARGYFGIGVYHPKKSVNIGSLFRSASLFGAAFVFTVGKRYSEQSSDTCKTSRHTPLFHFADVNDLVAHLPHGCPLVGVELAESARPLPKYVHRSACCYLLGAEDHGLDKATMDRCHDLIVIPFGEHSMNVACAGSIVLYDRASKGESA